MIELTEEQRRAAAAESPLRLLDRSANREYVLVPAELYERVRSLLEDGLDRRDVARLVERAMAEYDAADPLLDGYQKYRR